MPVTVRENDLLPHRYAGRAFFMTSNASSSSLKNPCTPHAAAHPGMWGGNVSSVPPFFVPGLCPPPLELRFVSPVPRVLFSFYSLRGVPPLPRLHHRAITVPPLHPAGLSSCRANAAGNSSPSRTACAKFPAPNGCNVPDGASHLFPCTAPVHCSLRRKPLLPPSRTACISRRSYPTKAQDCSCAFVLR